MFQGGKYKQMRLELKRSCTKQKAHWQSHLQAHGHTATANAAIAPQQIFQGHGLDVLSKTLKLFVVPTSYIHLSRMIVEIRGMGGGYSLLELLGPFFQVKFLMATKIKHKLELS